LDDAIAVLVLDERGELKTHKVGALIAAALGASSRAVVLLMDP
jgi:hypothetical protein